MKITLPINRNIFGTVNPFMEYLKISVLKGKGSKDCSLTLT